MKKTWKEKMDVFVLAIEKIRPLLACYALLLFILWVVFIAALNGKIFPNNAAAELVFIFLAAYLVCEFSLNVILTLGGAKNEASRKWLIGFHIAAIAFGIPAVWFFGVSFGFSIWQNLVILSVGVVIGICLQWLRNRNQKEKEND